MKRKECPSCAMEVDAKDKVCPICGYEFPRKNPVLVWAIILLVLIFLLYSIF